MDAKITLSFNANVIERAKKYAEAQNISLSRLMEFLLDNITTNQYKSLEDFPISNWVNIVSEGQVEYIKTPKASSKLKAEYRNRKK